MRRVQATTPQGTRRPRSPLWLGPRPPPSRLALTGEPPNVRGRCGLAERPFSDDIPSPYSQSFEVEFEFRAAIRHVDVGL